MIDVKHLRFVFIVIAGISVVFSFLAYWSIPYQFYLWEIFIDFKILSLACFIIYIWKKFKFSFFESDVKLWSWKKILSGFFSAVILIIVSIGAGKLIGGVFNNDVDNKFTLILSALFDTPAVFVFSVTTLFVDEVFFRSLLLRSIHQNKSYLYSIFIVSVLWMIFKIPDIVLIGETSLLSFGALAAYFFSMSIVCSALVVRTSTIWIGYSFRVGLTVMSPLLLKSFSIDSDPFFTTKSVWFTSDGYLFSLILLASGAILLRQEIMQKFIQFRGIQP